MEELKTFNLLQIQMQKRTEELQKLRLNLLAPVNQPIGAIQDQPDSEGNKPGTRLPRPSSATSGRIETIGDDGLGMTVWNSPPLLPRTAGGLKGSLGGTGGLQHPGRMNPLGNPNKCQDAVVVPSDNSQQTDFISPQHSGIVFPDGYAEHRNVPETGDTENTVEFGKESTYDWERSEVGELVGTLVHTRHIYSQLSEVNHAEHASDFHSDRSPPEGQQGNVAPNIAPRITEGTRPNLRSFQMLECGNRSSPSFDSHSCTDIGVGKDHRQSLASSRSLPASQHYRRESTETTQLGEESATGRVLLDSLANESRLEVQLSRAEDEIKELKMKINQLECIHSEETSKNRGTVEGLLLRIDEISRSKQNQINERVNECRAKDQVISQLTKTLRDAETAVTLLEQTLDSTERDLSQERGHSTRRDQALLEIYNSVRGQVTAGEGDTPLTPHRVAGRVQVYIQGQGEYISGLLEQLQESNVMSDGLRVDLVSTVEKLTTEHKQRLHQMNEEHSKLMEAATERAMNARKQTLGLQAQLEGVEEHSQQELDAKAKQITDLVERLKIQTEQSDAMRCQEQGKVMKTEEEMKRTLSDLEAKTMQVARLEEETSLLKTELDNIKENLKDVETSLNEERDERSKVMELRNKSEADLGSCRKELEEKRAELKRLSERMSEEVKQHQEKLEAEVSLVKKDSEDRLLQEKQKYQEEISDHQKKLMNSEQEQKQITSELKKLKERNSSHRNKLRELESKLEIVSKEKTDIATVLDGRERDLVVLRHERDLLENMLEKNRKESQLELRDKDAIEQSLQDIKSKYHELLTENQRLLSEVDQEMKKNVEIEKEKRELVGVLEKTKTEWERVKELKSDVGEKLNVKEKRLKHLTDKLERVQSSCSEKNSEMNKLGEENKKLKGNLKELKLKMSEMSKERDRDHQKTSQQLKNAEQEKGLMSSQIKILQRELRTVRGTMKANQFVDGKAKEVAAGMRQDATLHRDLVESLQGEINWLEECLQETQKTGEKLLVERNSLQASLQKAEKKIGRFQEEYQGMAKRRKEQKGLVNKLEGALEKATIRFGESQLKNERLAQELATLRLHHQLELKELKGNLLNQLTSTFVMPKVENNSPNRTNTPTDKVEKSPIQVNSTGRVPNPAVEEELRILLQGILKSMVMQDDDPGKERLPHGHDPPRRSAPSNQKHRQQLNNSHLEDRGQQNRTTVTKRGEVGQIHKDNEPPRSVTPPSSLTVTPDQLLISPSSPVSMLLGYESPPTPMREQVAESSRIEGTSDSRNYSAPQGYTADPSRDVQGADDARMRGVQDKLSRLVAMGSKLRDRNKEIELFLEDEDT